LIDPARIRVLVDRPPQRGDYVLYWMQQSQRTRCNHALELATWWANELGVPLVVGFGLTDSYPGANARHFAFMLQGLREVERELVRRGIAFVLRRGSPPEVAQRLAAKARVVICDVGYLRHQRQWRRQLAQQTHARVLQVETDVVVPVELASDHREYAARTLRPKLHRLIGELEHPLRQTRVRTDASGLRFAGHVSLHDITALIGRMKVDRTVRPVRRFTGGSSHARRNLRSFLRDRLVGYATVRNEPTNERVSYLSPYLHFGQISALEVLLETREATHAVPEDRAAFIEELVVRRELAANFVHHESSYDRYRCLPDWAKKTLDAHRSDARPHRYTRSQLEAARTHDPYWNAAMREMVHTGYMHNTMRMYWGKKILEWSSSPEHAYRTTIVLNDKYFLDGRDPNGYANVAWCYGLHDRPWAEREIFGTVRFMSIGGLERKYDMAAYVRWVDELVGREREV
jgi:deoxyribodipyrimidine photo-lyase